LCLFLYSYILCDVLSTSMSSSSLCQYFMFSNKIAFRRNLVFDNHIGPNYFHVNEYRVIRLKALARSLVRSCLLAYLTSLNNTLASRIWPALYCLWIPCIALFDESYILASRLWPTLYCLWIQVIVVWGFNGRFDTEGSIGASPSDCTGAFQRLKAQTIEYIHKWKCGGKPVRGNGYSK